jgi:hypothetical protein
MVMTIDPTYKITVIVERSDWPWGKIELTVKDIPRASAEDPSYPHFSAVECFRQHVISETRPDPREG